MGIPAVRVRSLTGNKEVRGWGLGGGEAEKVCLSDSRRITPFLLSLHFSPCPL